jgi:hypothetical protein
VDYVDLNLFAAVPETIAPSALAALGASLSGVADRIPALADRVRTTPAPALTAPATLPAQLAILLPDVPTSVMLTEIPHE